MAAAMRGGSPSRVRSQARPKVAQPPRRPAKQAKAKPYAPAKLAAAQSLGLAPLTAVSLAAAIVLAGVVAVLATDPHVHRMRDKAIADIDRGLIGLGLKVATVQVQGATPAAAADILKAAALGKDQPILHLDLAALRGRIEQVGWVRSAKVVRLLPDTIIIAVTQRQTMAVWQHAGRTLVIDDTGRAIPEADPGQFTDLPLVVGEGADRAAPAMLKLLQPRPRLMDRLDAVVRVDDRRWDLRTKDGGLIELPADGTAAALDQLDRLDQQSRILDLGFARIDLRDPDLVAVRPRDAGPTPAPAASGA
ncbi:MAG TPA: cell division protein FtsQ/DivIB [Caulobacteraceae bacterium]|jgi:cell division protein FtsQ|nr:cell division protein FtsQ/DivIB [Caulobacteraceae bacterium]